MKLFVCHDILKNVRYTPRPGGHPCGQAHHALKQAGHTPDVEAVGGLGAPPFNGTAGRKKIKQMTGQTWVPVLQLDDGELIQGSKEIRAWAEANPAGGA